MSLHCAVTGRRSRVGLQNDFQFFGRARTEKSNSEAIGLTWRTESDTTYPGLSTPSRHNVRHQTDNCRQEKNLKHQSALWYEICFAQHVRAPEPIAQARGDIKQFGL